MCVCEREKKISRFYQIFTSEEKRIACVDDLNNNITARTTVCVKCVCTCMCMVCGCVLVSVSVCVCVSLYTSPSLQHSPELSPEMQVLLERSKDELLLLLLQFGEMSSPNEEALSF